MNPGETPPAGFEAEPQPSAAPLLATPLARLMITLRDCVVVAVWMRFRGSEALMEFENAFMAGCPKFLAPTVSVMEQPQMNFAKVCGSFLNFFDLNRFRELQGVTAEQLLPFSTCVDILSPKLNLNCLESSSWNLCVYV